MQVNHKIKTYGWAYVAFFIYSISGIFSKLAAGTQFLSFSFITMYLLSLLILGVYALMWQKVLKLASLTGIYAHKSITLLFSMVWGAFLFQETIKWNMILGALIIVAGIVLVTQDEA